MSRIGRMLTGRSQSNVTTTTVCVVALLASFCSQVAWGDGLQLSEPRVARISLGRPTPHPAVVRVMVPERNATSHGSGTLVDTHDRYGLVVTNWHVVQDATSTIMVVFPDDSKPVRACSKQTVTGISPLWQSGDQESNLFRSPCNHLNQVKR